MGAHTGWTIDRRAALRSAILLVGGAMATVPMRAFAEMAASRSYFEPARFATLDAICETIIPTTDTPGASAAGVPGFIDHMMSSWASKATAGQIDRAIAAADAAVVASSGKNLVALPPADRTAPLSAHDAAGDADWHRLRELVLMGYYLSEAGATQELRFELAPGVWEPSVPVTAETRTWAV